MMLKNKSPVIQRMQLFKTVPFICESPRREAVGIFGSWSPGLVICWQLRVTEYIDFLNGKIEIKISSPSETFPTVNSLRIITESYSFLYPSRTLLDTWYKVGAQKILLICKSHVRVWSKKDFEKQ